MSAACTSYNYSASDKFKGGATQKLFAEPCELTDCHCNSYGTRRRFYCAFSFSYRIVSFLVLNVSLLLGVK